MAMALARAVVVLNERSIRGRSKSTVIATAKEEEGQGKLKLHYTEELVNFCCNRGFTSEAAYQKHLKEVETHSDKPLDPEGIRKMAEDAALWEGNNNPDGNEELVDDAGEGEEWDGDEMEMMPNVEAVYEDDEDGDGEGGIEGEGEAGGGEEEVVTAKPVARGKRRKKAKKTRGKTKCELCDLLIPATNIRRHIRVCHNPRHQFPCRYCSCRFLVAYGRMVHEVKNHRGPVGTQPPVQLRAAIKVKKKVTQAVRPMPPTRALVQQQQGGNSIAQAKSVVANISEEDMAQFRSQIRKVGKTGDGGKSRYECLICNKTFLGSRNATDHMNSHYGLKPYKCPLCDFYFSFRSNVVRHVKTCHTENSDFVCPYGCGCSMQSSTSLKVHMNLVCTLRNQYQNSAPIKLAVPAMQKTANPAPTLLKMVAPSSSSAGQAGIAATEADLRSVSIHAGPRQLKEKYAHLEVSPGIYGCQYCGKTITGSGNFRDHLNIHLNIRPHKCPRCYMKFTFKSNIKRHLASAHVPNGTFKCPMKCGCQMDNQHALQSHLNKCKLEFPKQRREMIAQQAKNSKPPVKLQPQVQKPQLQPQMQRMIKQEPSQANVSRPLPPLQKVLPRPPPLTPAPKFVQQQIQQRLSAQRLSPVSEAESSSSTAKYQCKVCHKSVSCRRNLDNHMLIHMNVKPCKCLICGLHFRTMDTLKKHNVKSHGANSPFKCHLCPCRFSQVQGLNMHINIHHKVKAQSQEYEGNGEYQDDQDQGNAEEYEMEIAYGAEEGQDQNDEMQDDDADDNVAAAADPIKINWSTARTKDGNFKCHLCGKVLKKGLHLRNHMRIHSGEKPFKCGLCGHRFRLASTLYDHKKSSHRGGNYHCDLCNCSFATNLGLSRHKGIFHNASIGDGYPQKTPTLTSSYQTQQYLQRKARFIKEKAVKSLLKPNTSTSVVFRGSTESVLKKRLVLQQNRVGIKKPSQPVLKSNVKSEQEDVFQCGHCQLSLPSLQALSEHQRIHQNQKEVDHEATANGHTSNPVDGKHQLLDLGDETGPSPRKCPICNQGIHGRKHYNKHMRGCHSGGPYRCIYCPCTFDSQGNLSRHHTLMHANLRSSPRPNLTNVKAPVASSSTQSHQNSGTQEQEFEIENGGEQYYEEGEEMSYQDEEEPPAGVSFQDESSIPIEMTPLGKRYKCLDCGKMFDRLTRYKLHVTVHTDEKPYQCPNCDQRFRLPGILNTHIKKSHGNGDFHCSQCPSRFTSAKGLSVHEFVYHKGGRGVTQGNPQKAGPSSQSQAQAIRNVPVNQMVKKILPKPQPQTMSEPRPVKLKCHICHQIFFGTTSLREHMKEHVVQPKVPIRMPIRQSAAATTQQRANYSAGSRMQLTQRRSLPAQQVQFQQPHHFLEQEMETEDDGAFEIVGYDNGYEEESVQEGHEEESQDYEYYEGEEGQNEGEESYDYSYMNAEDHLEIVHEEGNYEYDEGEGGIADDNVNGLDLEMQPVDIEEEPEGDEQADYSFEQQESEMEAINCKGCGSAFETRDAFAYHVESNESEGQVMCPYCCTQGINTETLPSHIEDFHTLDEVEFLEAQVYSDM